MPLSATDSISPAIQHTKQHLFQPFKFWQWTRLALVGLLAGEMGSSSSGFRSPSNGIHLPPSGGGTPFPGIEPAAIAAIIAFAIVVGIIFLLVMTYISSVMRFILFDSILAKQCHIRAGWSRRQGPGLRYFLWQIGFLLATLAIAVIFIGLPVGFALVMGWFKAPREHLAPLILGGIAVFLLFVALVIAIAVVHVLTKDFVVPQMALENIGAIEGWRRLLSMMRAEKGGYAGYVLMKIVLAIAAAIVFGLAALIASLVVLIPVVGVVVAVIFAGKAAGMTWNVLTITYAVIVALCLLAGFLYMIALISVPAIVFFPAYSIYFFASRYPLLNSALNSSAAQPAVIPAQQPPPLPPLPEMGA